MSYNCKSADDVLKVIKDDKIEMIDLRFTDIPGLWQHFSVPPRALGADSFADGVGFDGSSIRGFQEIQESDMLVLPDPATAFRDPFAEAPTLVLICSISDPITGQPYSRDPRFIAQKAETYLKVRGSGMLPISAPSLSTSSLTRCITTRAPTTATMRSILWRRTGRREGARVSATSCAQRKAISLCRRPTPCRT